MVASRGWGGGHKDVISNIQQILQRVAVQSKDILNQVLRQTVDRLKNSEDIEAPSDSEVKHLQQQLDQVVAEHETLKETLWGLKQEKERREPELTSPTTLSPRPLRSVSVPQLSLSSVRNTPTPLELPGLLDSDSEIEQWESCLSVFE